MLCGDMIWLLENGTSPKPNLLNNNKGRSFMLKIAVCNDEKYCEEKIVSLLKRRINRVNMMLFFRY